MMIRSRHDYRVKIRSLQQLPVIRVSVCNLMPANKLIELALIARGGRHNSRKRMGGVDFGIQITHDPGANDANSDFIHRSLQSAWNYQESFFSQHAKKVVAENRCLAFVGNSCGQHPPQYHRRFEIRHIRAEQHAFVAKPIYAMFEDRPVALRSRKVEEGIRATPCNLERL